MTDNKEIIICPACGKEMKKIYLPDYKFTVDICVNGCGGIYFDNRELEFVDEPFENADAILKELDNLKFIEVDTTQQRVCPVCGTIMLKQGAAAGEVEIDVCAQCGGKFLDAGELQKIRKTPIDTAKNAEADAIVDKLCEDFIEHTKTRFNGLPGYEKRRDFFVKIISKYIEKGN